MFDAGVLRAADLVFDPGVRAVPGLQEDRLPGGGVGGQELVAPPIGLLQHRQLRPRAGAFPPADQAHAGRPAG
jgi:hypothetical protein